MEKENLFIKELLKLKNHYRTRDAFVTKWGVEWDEDEIYNKCISEALMMYDFRVNSPIPITLLGESALQSDKELLVNFGFASVSDRDEKNIINQSGEQPIKSPVLKREQFIRQLVSEREQAIGFIKSAPPSPDDQLKRLRMPNITGKGSILGDNNWTTMMNDALIIGGVDGHHTFHLALSPKECVLWEKMMSQRAPSTTPIPFNSHEWKDIWHDFIEQNPSMIWQGERKTSSKGIITDYDQPRVFARELLGLKLFGYKPFYTNGEITFQRLDQSTPTSFVTYTDYLLKNYYGPGTEPTNKINTLNEISEFLFDDPHALQKISRDKIVYE